MKYVKHNEDHVCGIIVNTRESDIGHSLVDWVDGLFCDAWFPNETLIPITEEEYAINKIMFS